MNLWIPVLPGKIITCGYSEYSGSGREQKERYLLVLATETVLKQAEKIAEGLTGN